MKDTLLPKREVNTLERKLNKETDFRQRLLLLNQLVGHFVFTNVPKAGQILADLETALAFHPNEEIRLNFLIKSGLLENQLYNYNLAEQHFSKALDLVDHIGTGLEQVDAFIDYAGVLINLAKLENAQIYLDKAEQLLKSFPDNKLEARLNTRQAYLKLHYGKVGSSVNLFLEAENKITIGTELSLKDYYFLTLIYSGLGNIYKEVGQKENCVKAYLKVLDICQDIGMKTRLSWHYLNVGNAYLEIANYDLAEAYLKKAIKVPDDINQSSRAGATADLGYCYFSNGKYKEALQLYNKAERLYKDKGGDNSYQLFSIERWRAELYIKRNIDKKTQKHLIKAFHYAKKTNNDKVLSAILGDITKYYEKIGEYEHAFDFQKLYIKAVQGFYEQSKEKMVLELQIKYEAEKRKQQAELLELEATQLQLRALRSQMNPHFMYNALNAIQQHIMNNEKDTASAFLVRFANLMRNSLSYSELESIPLEKEIEFLNDYLLINQKLRFDNFTFQIESSPDIEEDIIGIPTMIIQPYVENAIEHGLRTKEKGSLSVYFSMADEDTVLCVVQDDGIGRAEAGRLNAENSALVDHQSMGTSITERRLELLQKSHHFSNLSVDTIDLFDPKTGVANGTKVLIRIPIVDTMVK